jgi:hypothetical protein
MGLYDNQNERYGWQNIETKIKKYFNLTGCLFGSIEHSFYNIFMWVDFFYKNVTLSGYFL